MRRIVGATPIVCARWNIRRDPSGPASMTGGNCFTVARLTDQNDIRFAAQRVTHPKFESFSGGAGFQTAIPAIYPTAMRIVHEFDWRFIGQHLAATLFAFDQHAHPGGA